MKDTFPYYRLYWQDFEDVTIEICRDILGIACKKFSDGPDGGRDSKFNGTTNKYPSLSQKWSGNMIIQAKHTSELNKSCSDNDFSAESKNSIVSKEIERLKKLMITDPFNSYILFTNRKLTAGSHQKICDRIKKELSVNNVEVLGSEEIDSHLTQEMVAKLKLSQFFTPLRIFEKDIQEVIIAFDDAIEDLDDLNESSISRISIETKNELNTLSKAYFDFINSTSLHHFAKIRMFLSQPQNSKYLKYYDNTINDLQAKILLKRQEYSNFEAVIEDIIELVLSKYEDKIKDCRRMARVFVHYMYYNCDIGQS